VLVGPFPNSDTVAGQLTGFTGVAAMAIQNAAQRVQLIAVLPTTIMTGNTTRAVSDAVDWLGA
jgi:uncharacterized membrane protein YoaK (UPF0700 family)